METVKREDFPSELWQAMEEWAWSVTSRWPSSTTSIISLEGRMRANRCPMCYQDPEPCKDCEIKPMPRRQVDIDLCDAIERAWRSMSQHRVEKTILREYFVLKHSPRYLSNALSFRRDDFWFLLLRGAQEIYQLARIDKARNAISCNSKHAVPQYVYHEQVSDRAGCLDDERRNAALVATR